jgi:MFS family permease
MLIQPVRDRNISIFYFLTMAQAAGFVAGNWIFFWLRLMTFGELGLIDALGFAFGLIMEVPTGAISDLVGKRRTVMLANLCLGLGYVIMAAADVTWVLIAGFWLTQIGWAFYSGATEALVYDSLKERGQESRFGRVLANATTLDIITLLVATLLGGLLYTLDERLPHYARGAVFGLAVVAAFWLREPRVTDQQRFSISNYLRQMGAGFRELANPSLRPFLPLIFTTRGVFYLFAFGLVSPTMAIAFGFDAGAQAVVFAIIGLFSALGQRFVPVLRRSLPEYTGMLLFAVALGLGFAGGALPLGACGFAALLLIHVGGTLAATWSSILINDRIPSNTRATTLSVVALIVRIPYVLTAIIAGAMAEAGTFPIFSGAVAALIAVVIAISSLISSRLPSNQPV